MSEVGLMEGAMPVIPEGFGGVMDGRGRPQIVVRGFTKTFVEDPEDPKKLKEVHWVEWGKPGVANWSTKQKIDQLRPRTDRHPPKPAALEWQVIGPYYEAWLKGEQAPVVGTPIDAMPGLPPQIATALKQLGVLSVEDLADLPDDRVQRLPYPKVRDHKMRAKRWVEAMNDETLVTADKLKASDDKIAELERRNAEKDERLDQVLARLAELEAAQPQKRGPGRPRKEEQTHDHAVEPEGSEAA